MATLDTYEYPNYKAEIWFTYGEKNAEDDIEEMFREFLKSNGMCIQGGPVIFKYNFG